MGIVSIQKFDNDSLLGLWHITESLEELLLNIELTPIDQVNLEKRISLRRKKEWLACKNLMRSINNHVVPVRYDLNGKPFDDEGKYQISMSHSGQYACVYLSPAGPVGADVQKLKPTITASADYFLNDEELHWADISNNALMHLLWSAKEAAFKFAGQNELNVKKDIVIKSFNSNQNEPIEVTIYSRKITEKIRIDYYFFDEYVLTWTVKSNTQLS